ncbi:PREDICTED: aluminum-activated malate transporter 12-like [Nelumbo nucifera]|uniref:Aluminum-activated malate transporter 12-like n=2 Tax=Nelumbo nucifera TaxID=4432 RepID=A0A822ZRM0_NELNU|nr:PREDICTED: aluminum-activated malate transporter 12-like [Nelumbo nucifera]DAD47527.1 TPA_asm: hypothetical protein HUJ06_017464 [Nelumbo nucifera]
MENSGNEVFREENNEAKIKQIRLEIEIALTKMRRSLGLLWRKIWRVGREDPRRVIHSLKVGLALTLVSFLYLMEPLFKGVGQNAIWAVMTVVVVLEFTAGATLCKGLNRGVGTLCAGSLAFFIEYIANESSHIFRAVFIGFAVFLIGAAATYMRFFPNIKKNYDYGVVIFLLTFNLITVSSYRVHNVFRIAHERFYTIAIGCVICLFMSLIFPNWSREDLHNSIVLKLEGLARSIEACVKEYFQDEEIKAVEDNEESSEDHIYNGYKEVLDSKSSDETLALHASWEPRHSRHCHRYPWQQYVKLGAALRHFGHTAVALHGCLQSEIQTPHSVRALFKDPCIRVAREVSKVLIELADSIRERRCFSPEVLSDHLHEALQDLNSSIRSQPRLLLGSSRNKTRNMLTTAATVAKQNPTKDSGVSLSFARTDPSAFLEWRTNRVIDQSRESETRLLRPALSKFSTSSFEFSEALPFAAFASLLVETVARLGLIIEEVEQLGRQARFREVKPREEQEQIKVTCERPPRRVNAVELQPHLDARGIE